MASDQSAELTNIKVALLALRPGFNSKLLDEPANSWFKVFFLDPWDVFTKAPRIKVVTIENVRALIFDDQPASADEAVTSFVRSISR